MELNERIFLIIDGNAILHRAFHAIPNFTTKTGVPTGAIYGFFSMLLKLLQELKPEYLAVTFDRPKPTFRKALYVGYQAHRPKMDDGLSDQIKAVHEILEKARIPIYEVDGFEADDVIGTLANQAQNSKRKTQNQNLKLKALKTEGKDDSLSEMMVYIVSGDRDMLQLVNHKIKVLAPVKGISEVMLFDSSKVLEKYGLNPCQMIDYKSLAGDASDNYTGVPGIGPKTACSLILEYGSTEDIYKNIDKVKEKNENLAKKLIDGSDMAILAKQLATISKEVPFSFKMDDCKVEKMAKDEFINALAKYELKSLVKRAEEIFGIKPMEEKKKKKTQMKLL